MSFASKVLAATTVFSTLGLALVGGITPADAWHEGPWGTPVVNGVLRPEYGMAYRPAYEPSYGFDPIPVYDPCTHGRKPFFDVNGNFVGYRVMRVCN